MYMYMCCAHAYKNNWYEQTTMYIVKTNPFAFLIKQVCVCDCGMSRYTHTSAFVDNMLLLCFFRKESIPSHHDDLIKQISGNNLRKRLKQTGENRYHTHVTMLYDLYRRL